MLFSSDVPLGPADYVFTGVGSVPITFAFFYPSALPHAVLQKSLDATLQAFPSVSGKLVRTGSQDYAFRSLENGLPIEVSQSNESFAESRRIDRFIKPVETREDLPLSRIRLTRTRDGSVLAASISHALVDGFSYFHFFSSWARITRGDRFVPPSLNREMLGTATDAHRVPLSPETLLELCGLHLSGRRGPSASTSLVEERIPIAGGQLRAMLQEARADQPETAFSENDVVTAWLWRRFLPTWLGDSSDSDTYMSCPVDCRRVYRVLPRNYFGCALCFASASASLADLREAALGDIARRIHDSVRNVGNDFAFRSWTALEHFRHQHGLSEMERIHLKHPERGMIVTNLTRMPLGELDFGEGPPADLVFHSDVTGSAALLPAKEGLTAVVLHPEAAVVGGRAP